MSVLNAVKAVPEVCRVHCATANPTAVVVANVGGGGGRSERRAVLGVADGLCPVAFETDGDKEKRKVRVVVVVAAVWRGRAAARVGCVFLLLLLYVCLCCRGAPFPRLHPFSAPFPPTPPPTHTGRPSCA